MSVLRTAVDPAGPAYQENRAAMLARLADLDAALPFLVNSGIQNAGQTCSAASRILVERPVFDKVRTMMAERYRALRVGPAALDLDVGGMLLTYSWSSAAPHHSLG